MMEDMRKNKVFAPGPISTVYERSPLTVAEAACVLGCTPLTVRRMLARGELLGFRVGRGVRVIPESVVAKRRGARVPNAAYPPDAVKQSATG